MQNTLEELEDQIRRYTSVLVDSFDNVDEKVKILSCRRKEILLVNAKEALKKLNEIDQDSYLNIILLLCFEVY